MVVIGAGPGGYVAAIKAAQLGMKVCSENAQFIWRIANTVLTFRQFASRKTIP